MGFSINSNIYALLTQSYMSSTATDLASSVGHLSSGLRITSAADDPAGLAESMALTSQSNGWTQGMSNTQNTLSLVQTASGALNETTDILQRMRSLTVQSLNGTNSSNDLNAIQGEMNQLATELTQITNSTTYNTRNLLSGALQNAQFQLGPNAGNTVALSINPMDAASLGVAGNTATIKQVQNTAVLQSLTGAGSGLLGANLGEQYQITTTQLNGGVGGATFNASGTVAGVASAAQNQGGESLNLAFSAGAAFTGATANYQTQVTSVNAQGGITGIQYSTSATGTPVWTQVTSSTGVFSLGANLTTSFTAGAATAQVGDQFTLTATAAASLATIQSTQASGTNIGRATGAITGSYTGTSNLQYAVRAVQIDTTAPNNVVGVQVSTDGGKTFGSTVTATEGAGPLAAGTVTHFAIGSGLTFAWTPGAFNNNQVANNGDTLSFNAVAANQSTQVLQLSDSTLVSGVAKFAGTAANIGPTALLNAGQTSATVGTGTQTVLANFNAIGTASAIAPGSTTFSITTPQAAIVANGSVLAPATATAALNITTTTGANNALNTINNAITTVALQQGQLGGLQSSLTDALNVASVTQENLTNANSAIMDVNVATELVKETRLKILQQAQIALLAQANQIPSSVLKLLG